MDNNITTITVTLENGCKNCVYEHTNTNCKLIKCSSSERKDKRNVIYVRNE